MKKAIGFFAISVFAALCVSVVRDAPVHAQPPGGLIEAAPVGSIVAWPGQAGTIPPGWMECNGDMVDRTKFPALAKAIGTTWGGVGTTEIRLPELRGYFLRGVSGDTNNDPNKNDRTVPAGGSSNGPGSSQLSALKDHRHRMANQHFLQAEGGDGFEGAGYSGNSENKPVGPFFTVGVDGGIAASETRPLNAYVYWIIRAK